MRILEDDTVTLKRVRFRFERSRICINGRRTWFTLEGITLEKAIQIGSCYLLFVSTNEGGTYWSKSCDVYLINQSGRILEHAWIIGEDYDDDDDDDMFFYDYYIGYPIKFNLILPNIITFEFRGVNYSIGVMDKPVYPLFGYCSDKDDQRKKNNVGYFVRKSVFAYFRSRLIINIIQKLEA